MLSLELGDEAALAVFSVFNLLGYLGHAVVEVLDAVVIRGKHELESFLLVEASLKCGDLHLHCGDKIVEGVRMGGILKGISEFGAISLIPCLSLLLLLDNLLEGGSDSLSGGVEVVDLMLEEGVLRGSSGRFRAKRC